MFKLNEQALEIVSGGVWVEVEYVPKYYPDLHRYFSVEMIRRIEFQNNEELRSCLEYLQSFLKEAGVTEDTSSWRSTDVENYFRGKEFTEFQKAIKYWLRETKYCVKLDTGVNSLELKYGHIFDF